MQKNVSRRTRLAALTLGLALFLTSAAACAKESEEPLDSDGITESGEADSFGAPVNGNLSGPDNTDTLPQNGGTSTETPTGTTAPSGSSGSSNPTDSSGSSNPTGSSGSSVPSGSSTVTVNGSVGLTYTSNGNGTCTLTGIGSCTDACVVIPDRNAAGDRVTAIGERAFYGVASIAAVQIPASVQSIGALAFAACSSLTFLSVTDGNTAYKTEGGVLYSADGTRLLVYPAARADTVCRIASTVRTVESMAFYNCKNLRTIRYAGTQEQWASVSVGDANYSLYTASILCTDSGK